MSEDAMKLKDAIKEGRLEEFIAERPATLPSSGLFFNGRWKHRKQLAEHLLRLVPRIVAVVKLVRVLLEMLLRNVDVGPADRVLEA